MENFFISFFSSTVYGVPFSAIVIIGAVIMGIGGLFIVSEPASYVARKRG